MSELATYNDITIHFDSNELINITDMWKATGKGEDYKPYQWLRHPATLKVLKALKKSKGVSHTPLKKQGRYGGTFATAEVALAYAQFLSPEFHVWALGVIKERFEGFADPELDIKRTRERAIKSWRKKGWSDARIDARLAGIDTRKVFTSMLAKHGIHGYEFKNSTNSMYIALFGGNAKDLREDRDLPAKANLRDHMTKVELSAVQLVEAMASEVIEDEERHGPRDCCRAIVKTGAAVAPVLEKFKKLKAA